MKLSAGAISTGTFNREFYIWHGMDPGRIWPGVCPADTDAFAVGRSRAPGADAQHSAPGDSRLRIGFAGKLIPRKGPDELLRAVALLPPGTDYCLTLVGDGPMLPELRCLAGRLGVADRVRFTGFANTTQMPGLLAGCDVVVVPSRRDMRALVTIEAMAAGAAVVVSDATAVWGPGDLVQHEVTGLVYPSGDEHALAAALGRLAAGPELLARLRDAGARRAAGYGPEAFARTMAAAVTRGPGRPPGRGGTVPGIRQRSRRRANRPP
jgi:glycosyltransferase involved in cell wall biosynthesis